MRVDFRHLLTLTRPFVVFDLEATGPDPEQDRIVQIGMTIHYPDKDPIPWVTLVNPGIPIPKESTEEAHGITDEMVKDAPKFSDLAPRLVKHLTDVDFGGYNIRRYDLPLIAAEMKRAGVEWSWDNSFTVDAFRIYQTLRPRNLQAAYKEFVDEKGFEDAHTADADVAATEAVLHGQLTKYPEIPREMQALSEYCFPPENFVDKAGKLIRRNGVVCIGFGANKNKPLKDVPKGYISWMMRSNFPDETKEAIKKELGGLF